MSPTAPTNILETRDINARQVLLLQAILHSMSRRFSMLCPNFAESISCFPLPTAAACVIIAIDIFRETCHALERCRAAGIKLIFATARPRRTVLHFMNDIPADALVLHNGAVVYAGEKMLLQHGIASADKNAILCAISRDYPQATLSLEIDDTLYANFDVSALWNYTQAVRSDFSDLPDRPADKILIGISSVEELPHYAQYLPEDLYIQSSEGKLGMIMNRAATKWNAIRCLAGHFGIPAADMLAFGDDWNDIELLRNCGTGVAVANALEKARAAANFVCGSNDEDGVAKWLEAHVLCN